MLVAYVERCTWTKWIWWSCHPPAPCLKPIGMWTQMLLKMFLTCQTKQLQNCCTDLITQLNIFCSIFLSLALLRSDFFYLLSKPTTPAQWYFIGWYIGEGRCKHTTFFARLLLGCLKPRGGGRDLRKRSAAQRKWYLNTGMGELMQF
jgi:hypothetical protein